MFESRGGPPPAHGRLASRARPGLGCAPRARSTARRPPDAARSVLATRRRRSDPIRRPPEPGLDRRAVAVPTSRTSRGGQSWRWRSIAGSRTDSKASPIVRPLRRPLVRSPRARLPRAELENDGLPVDVDEAGRIIASFIGPRPLDAADDRRITDERHRRVLRHLGGGADTTHGIDLRSPASVKSLLRRIGIEVPDTRAWRLEQIRDEHPLVEDLLEWRRAGAHLHDLRLPLARSARRDGRATPRAVVVVGRRGRPDDRDSGRTTRPSSSGLPSNCGKHRRRLPAR